MRVRSLLLVLLACLAVDFADPSLPGVFVFDGDQTFIASAGSLGKASVGRTTPAHGPLAAERIDRDLASSTANAGAVTALRNVTRAIEHHSVWRPSNTSSPSSVSSHSTDDH